ncbi:MAG: hypothetical protein KatS3mg011_0568 [Acidimicrobiia bacterium]|nr:MAG: hypothetical protein KatS3mg011_0568 [Acidimicrobiia bacterium]
MTGTLGRDEHGGVPSHDRPDRTDPPNWRLDAVYSTARPHHLSVSPQRDRLAFVLSWEETSDLWLLDEGRVTTDRELTAFWEDTPPLWSPDGSRLAYSSGGAVWVVPVAGGPPKRLTEGSPAAWIDDTTLAITVERDRSTRLATIGIEDPWPRPLGPRGTDIGKVLVGPDGVLVVESWPREDRNRCDLLAVTEDEWSVLVSIPDRRATLGSLHGRRLAFLLEEEEWRALYVLELGTEGHEPLAKAEGDFGSVQWDDGDRLVATLTHRGRSDLVLVDGGVHTLAEGGSWQDPQWYRDGIVAVHESSTSPMRIVYLEGPSQRPLYDGAPIAVRRAPHAAAEAVRFSSGDGTEIEGFLYRPRDTGHPVPAVVYPHGGPTSHYGDEWDGHAQYFVDKGYAWLAINFRGSTSYGLSFERANHGDWGVGDVEDCIAAARYLASLGWVDPGRIAIYGASYGSYLALASLVHPDNPFACGVAKYGDCDILTSWAQGDRPGSDDLERMMGHPSSAREAYRRGSPIHSVSRLDRPILIAHGERDARVHPKQSEELVAELRRLGKTYEYVTYPTEGHGLLRREPHLHFYRRLERFLDWHLI